MALNQLFDVTSNLVNANLNRRNDAQGIMARNVSNLDTPGYQGTGLEFEKQLRAAMEGGILPVSMERTNPRHISTIDEDDPFSQAGPEYKNIGPVHLDIEMSKLAENNIMFNAMVTLLNKKFSVLKTAIADGGGGR